MPKKFTTHATMIAIVILALTSDVFQWILTSAPIQFLGKISYPFYLIHILFCHWLQRDTYNYMIGEGVSGDEAVIYVFLIWTPVLFLASWVLEILVDRPSKEFAGELDRQSRRVRPSPAPVLNTETGEMEVPDKR